MRSVSGVDLLHVGYPKASSTWLQDRLFWTTDFGFWPLLPNKSDRVASVEWLVNPDAWSDVPEEFYGFIEDRIRAKPDPGLSSVLSAEGLVGVYKDPSRAISKMLADRMRELFPDARVLIVLREQASMIKSSYLYYIRGGGWHTLSRFLNPPSIYEARAWVNFNMDFLVYDALIEYYQNLFGEDRVKVLPFELLQRDPGAYVEAIQDFAAVPRKTEGLNPEPVKRSIATGALPTRRLLNSLLSADDLNPLSFLLPEAAYWRVTTKITRAHDRTFMRLGLNDQNRLTAQIQELIGDYYHESNRRVMELTGLDLESYGYQVGTFEAPKRSHATTR